MAPVAGIRTRFDSFSRGSLLCICVALLSLFLLGLKYGVAPDPLPPASVRAERSAHHIGDAYLYLRIVQRVAAGESYYKAATSEQRERNYPLRPVFTVREPMLAWLLASLPTVVAGRLCLAGLAVFALGLWGWRVQRMGQSVALTAWGVFLLWGGCAAAFFGKDYLFHECWAGILLLISFVAYDTARDSASRHARMWLGASLLSALLAVLIRELAAPFLLVMIVMALAEKRLRETVLWCGVLAIFALFLIWHAHMVAGYTLPGDKASQGWVRFGGWCETLRALKWNGLLLLAPDLVPIIGIPVALLGTFAWPGCAGARLFLTCAGYAAGFCIFGRPENFYWGLVVVPLMGVGLSFAPVALWRFAQALRRTMVRKS